MTKIPSREKCLELLKDYDVPENIVRHSMAVAELAMGIAKKLNERGIDVNMPLLEAAALLHDIARDLPGDHATEGAKILHELGYEEVAETAKTHGLYNFPDIKPETIEQKILFYADKRVMEDRVVSLRVRFDDFRKRYPDYDKEKSSNEYEFAREIGKELGEEGE